MKFSIAIIALVAGYVAAEDVIATQDNVASPDESLLIAAGFPVCSVSLLHPQPFASISPKAHTMLHMAGAKLAHIEQLALSLSLTHTLTHTHALSHSLCPHSYRFPPSLTSLSR
jgi:hypothetical protein